MSKMGISTYQSYARADLRRHRPVERFIDLFTGTATTIEGAG
jgi:hypothetical protein